MKRYPDNYLNVAQGTPEWLYSRCGCVTASRLADVMSKGKNGKSAASREKYKLELLAEIVTGRMTEHYVSQAMDFGTENEPLARTVYELSQGVEVEQVGFVLHPRIKRSGASPDGLIGDTGLVEIKVPNTTTHLNYLLAGVVPEEYKPQMLWQMACTERRWCDFVSYDPRLPNEFNLFIARYERDGEEIGTAETEVMKFLAELENMASILQTRGGPHPGKDVNQLGAEASLAPERSGLADAMKGFR